MSERVKVLANSGNGVRGMSRVAHSGSESYCFEAAEAATVFLSSPPVELGG